MSGAKDEAKTTSESVMDKFIPRVKAEEEDEPEEEEEVHVKPALICTVVQAVARAANAPIYG